MWGEITEEIMERCGDLSGDDEVMEMGVDTLEDMVR